MGGEGMTGMETDGSWVLVEGPAWGDAQFYGEWLRAAAKAQVLWRTALEDQEFETQVERIRIVYEPDFGITATIMLMNLRAHWTSFVLDLQSEDGEDFAMMFSMGFFLQCGHTCRMAIPPLLTLDTLKGAILTFARTEDSEYILHPEHLVTCMSSAAAKVLQQQINAFYGSRGEQPSSLH
jgi:hypothetical protein